MLHAQQGAAPTATQARAFMEQAEKQLAELGIKANQASWVAANFITEDTEALSAEAQKNFSVAVQQLATDAKRFDRVQLPAELRRKFNLLKLSLSAPPPGNPGEATELSRLAAGMEAAYGRGKYCKPPRTGAGEQRPGETCLDIGGLSRIMATSRKPEELLDAWQGWHRVGAPMRTDYTRFVELSNKGARELGFRDAGAMWRSGYDMQPDEFAREVDGSGSRCGRFISRCTPTCAPAWARATAHSSSRRTG